MNLNLLVYIIYPFVISLLVSVIMIFFAKQSGAFIDEAKSLKPQRFHSTPTPRVGGLGIFIGFLLFGTLLFFNIPIFTVFVYSIIGGIIVFISGLIEDFKGNLSPKLRLLLQCVGVFIATFGANIYIYDLSFGFNLPYIIGILFTIFAVVGVINAFNIIDGFNGLASGLSLLVLIALFFVSYTVGNYFVFYASVLLFGAVLGFFVLNFPKGKIFLGDGGAYFLGFMLGFMLVSLTQTTHFDDASLWSLTISRIYALLGIDLNSALQASIISTLGAKGVSAWYGVALCIYPIWEVLFSIYRRKKVKRKATSPDNLHFHTLVFRTLAHQNNAKTSFYILAFNLPFIILSSIFFDNIYVLFALIIIFCVLYTLIYKRLLSIYIKR
ncbi:MraY family glycosyltransferase [Helicobacter sp. 11S02629-2]|uniref:glycosyltransferase family 4 protein n=1 Tax=Helicobacter sp. 11S02629-2 TaxID=1476195 RepID=UPI000BA5D6FA|nr:MraY family glycosyltransferase [Helicobacter sp. 11S02629-2]PAF44066.1 hypothetical protein BKH40_06245 [Helicobacter sp. 11S02629-2]